MNETTISANKMGWILTALMGSLLVWMMSGCADSQDQTRYRGGYYQQQPPPREVYAQPSSSVTVAASNGSVGFAIRTDSDFYEPLSPYGRWEVVGSYGRCWIPGRVDSNWRPYSDGYWQRTDAGWYWASDEPWGWATYHYGRWDVSPQYGWYWVPQTQWAPAWVSWHQGGGYVGWAPLYPSARVGQNGFVEVNARAISPRAYVFVQERQFLQPVRPNTVIVNNTTVINQTVNITNVKVVNNTVINEGPSTTVIERVSGQKVQAVPVREMRHKQEAAVVTQTRSVPPGQQKKVQPPVRAEAEVRDMTAAPAHEVRQVERQIVTTTAPEAPVVKKVAYETEVPKHATPPTAPEEATRAPQEKKHEMDSEKGKHDGERPVAAKAPTETKAQEHADKQEEKRAEKSEKKARQDSEHKGKKDQPASEPDETNTVNKAHEKKGEE